MKRWLSVIAVLGLLLAIGVPAQALNIERSYTRFACVAAEALTTGQVVMMKSDGLCYKADADDAALRPAIGVAATAASLGGTVGVVTSGIVGGGSALTRGGAVYLSGTAGGTTQTEPSVYSQIVGRAISTTQFEITIQRARPVQVMILDVENLAGGADIGDSSAANARTFYTAPFGLTLKSVSLYGLAAAAGIDDSNTSVIKVYNGASTVVTKTFNSTTAWPAAFTATSLGTLANTAVPAAAALKFDIVNGAAADPPAFNLVIEYYAGD